MSGPLPPPDGALALAELLLAAKAAIADQVKAIEVLEDQLRDVALAAGRGFVADLKERGSVQVTAARAARFTGQTYVADPELYLAMSEEERAALPAGLIVAVSNYSKAAKPSVRVSLP